MSLGKKKTDLQKLKNLPRTRDKTELKLAWHRNAVIRHWMGETTKSIAQTFNRGQNTVSELMVSPAAKELKAYLDEKLGDPAEFAKELAKANALNVTLDWYMALEWAKLGVRVNGIGPTYFETELVTQLRNDPERFNFINERTPMGRWGYPPELEGIVIFLASKASDFITGQIIYIDGGWTIW